MGDLEGRKRHFSDLLSQIKIQAPETGLVGQDGGVFVGSLQDALSHVRGMREPMFDQPGLMCIRRALSEGHYYFIANRGDKTIDGWIPLATEANWVCLMNPMTGQAGVVASRKLDGSPTEAQLFLPPGSSVILHVAALSDPHFMRAAPLPRLIPAGESAPIKGRWQVSFLSGGPVLPAPYAAEHLGSWTEANDTNAQNFAGTALYELKFDAPQSPNNTKALAYQLDLGKVCQSARVRLNGKDLGTLFMPQKNNDY